MNRFVRWPWLAGPLAVAAAAIAFLELGGVTPGRGAVLVTLVLWTGMAQGSVAVVAAAEITGARWVASVKRELLAAAHLLTFLAALFLLVWPLLDLYPWHASPGAWLGPRFFFGRNLALLAATAGAAHLFARRAVAPGAPAKRSAFLYLLCFVASQSLVAFDWVMSLAYPWVSSMFGLYFIVEALYAGVALAGLIFLLLDRDARAREDGRWVGARRDVALLAFGFSVLWGGLFFAQFMLIWYGNLPEEVGFVAERLASSPTRQLAFAFVAACFGAPFLGLLPARAKRSPLALGAVSATLLLGLLSEKLVFMLPAVPLSFGVLALQNLLLAGIWIVLVLGFGQTGSIPKVGAGAAGSGGGLA